MTVVKYCAPSGSGDKKEGDTKTEQLTHELVPATASDEREAIKKQSWEQSNLLFTAPTPKGLPEAVLNDRRESFHAEELRAKEGRRGSKGRDLIQA